MAKEQQTTSSFPLPEGTKMVKVRVTKTDKNDKRPHIYASVNAYSYMIKFGEWVEVPDFIAEVLEQREERTEYAENYASTRQK